MNLASPFALLLLGVVLVLMGFNVLREYERAVIFRWGRLARGLVGGNGPGVVIIIPFIDKLVRVSLRTVAMDVGLPLHPGAARYYREVGYLRE